MIKFLLSLTAPARRRPTNLRQEETLRWMRDPLSHPALETMDQRELGDLPFRR